jgi:hypothetical protein
LKLTRNGAAAVAAAAGASLVLASSATAAVSFDRTDYPLPDTQQSHVAGDGAVALVDLNKDGKRDIVVPDWGTSKVDVLLNQGAGAFAPAPGSPFSACYHPLHIVAGQLNPQTDQDPDVAVVCDDAAIGFMPGDGSGALGATQAHTILGAVQNLELGQVDDSTGGDYVFGVLGGSSYACFLAVTSLADPTTRVCDYTTPGSALTPVHFYANLCWAGDELLSLKSNTTWIGSAPVPTPGDPMTNCKSPFSQSDDRSTGSDYTVGFATGDLNGDGTPDVVLFGNGFHVVPWDPSTGIPPGTQPSNFTSAAPISSLKIADFDGDGHPDIAAAENDQSGDELLFVAIHAGQGTTTAFGTAQKFSIGGAVPGNADYPSIAVGDLNGDGKPDIVSATGSPGVVTVLINTVPTPGGGGGDGTPGGATPGGGTPGAGATDTIPPVFLAAKLTHKIFAVDKKGAVETLVAARAKKGTTFVYTLSEAGRVLFTIEQRQKGRRVGRKCLKPSRRNRNRKPCTRYVRIGRFAQASVAGVNRKKFSGRIGRRSLKPGRYRATLVASDAGGNKSQLKRLSFKVVRG